MYIMSVSQTIYTQYCPFSQAKYPTICITFQFVKLMFVKHTVYTVNCNSFCLICHMKSTAAACTQPYWYTTVSIVNKLKTCSNSISRQNKPVH